MVPAETESFPVFDNEVISFYKSRNKKIEEAREDNKGIPVRPNEEMDESSAKSERYDLAR